MSITQGLHRALQRYPQRQAIVDGTRSYTFAELGDRVARLAGGLVGLGARRGDRIAMLCSNRAEYVETALATAWMGGVLTPINYRWSAGEMREQIVDSSASSIVIDAERFEELGQMLKEDCPTLRHIVVLGDTSSGIVPGGSGEYETLIANSDPVPDLRADNDALCLIFYTGGTTGTPKGVMLTSRALITSALGTAASTGFSNLPERYLHAAPLFHIAGFSAVVWGTLNGATHVMLPEFDVAALAAVIENEHITAISLVPTMIERLLDHVDAHGGDLSSLRNLGYGGSPIPPPVLDRLLITLPHVTLRQSFGQTETGPVATMLRDEDHRNPAHPEWLLSVGRAAPHCEVCVVDPDDRELSIGEVGEIVVRGDNAMRGYWNLPELTAQTLRGGWVHTGDLGRFDAHGYLYVVDRLKDMIVSGGENVFSAEVEKVLQRHPAVTACCVVGVPDEQWGERVHAVIVTMAGASLTASAVRDYVGEHIARYKAPRTVDFVCELPLSPVGKILKRAVREQVIARLGESASAS